MRSSSPVPDGGSPEQRVQAWLQLTRESNGHVKAGDWMAGLIPFLDLHASEPAEPHPSVSFSFTVQPDHCNRLQNLHGGAAATLFDFCTTMALVLINRPGFWQYLGVSRSLNVTYLRPARSGEEVLVECHAVQVGKRLASLRGVMKRKSDGQLLSTCEHLKVNIDPEANL